jgi:hypothetical protein
MDEGIPTSGEQLGAQEQEALGHILSPECSRGFEPQIDDTADGAFHAATATGHSRLAEAFILHPRGIAFKVALPFLECLRFLFAAQDTAQRLLDPPQIALP